ncbi:capsular biosynthesis protein [Halomonas ventosae]|uniref:capsular biosynthesis protein n=1 Tax=Halomonas ventosae TaxID=229007 RepID=UPI00105B6394|nr:capsular biosynthesis protein [Halomonas ventosae]
MKKLVVDLDGTITKNDTSDYRNVSPNLEVVDKLRFFKSLGYEIIIQTARNMRTYEGNVGKINIHTLPIITEWLDRHKVPYDEVHVGKPWCGFHGFYVDDRAVRPSEFIRMSPEEIESLIAGEHR